MYKNNSNANRKPTLADMMALMEESTKQTHEIALQVREASRRTLEQAKMRAKIIHDVLNPPKCHKRITLPDDLLQFKFQN